MKHVLLVADGLSGTSIEALGDRTALAAANTPQLDRLAASGRFGVIAPDPWGRPLTAADLVTSVLGLDPATAPIGPAVLELGRRDAVPWPDQPADGTLLAVDLVTIENGRLIDPAGAALTSAETEAIGLILAPLVTELFGAQAWLRPLAPGRLGLGLPAGTTVDPLAFTAPEAIVGEAVDRARPSGSDAARWRRLIDESAGRLADLDLVRLRREGDDGVPTHAWPWGPGALGRRLNVTARYEGCRVAVLAGSSAVAGLAGVLEPCGGGDGGPAAWDVARPLAALGDHDLVVLGTELAAFEARETGGRAPVSSVRALAAIEDPAGVADRRVAAIERFDASVVGPLLEGLVNFKDDWRMALVAGPRRGLDGGLVAAPIPVVVAGVGFSGLTAADFDETSAERGELRMQPGDDLLEFLLFGAGVRRRRSLRPRITGGRGAPGGTPAPPTPPAPRP